MVTETSRELDSASANSRREAAVLALNADSTLAEAVEELERKMIREALRLCSGNMARAARELGSRGKVFT